MQEEAILLAENRFSLPTWGGLRISSKMLGPAAMFSRRAHAGAPSRCARTFWREIFIHCNSSKSFSFLEEAEHMSATFNYDGQASPIQSNYTYLSHKHLGDSVDGSE